MTRLTTAPSLALLLLWGSLSRIQAADTKVVVKDGGSILLRAGGLDAGQTWTVSPTEIRHQNGNGVLSSLRITDAGSDRCAGQPACGIDPAQPWLIQVTYAGGSLTIASVSANRGLHLTQRQLPFDQWQPTANADEREFGHGDGLRISNITVNHGDNLCSSGKGCEITVLFSPQ